MSGAAEKGSPLDVLLSKQALHELNTAYCRAMDRADEAALVALFHPEARMNGGMVNGDPKHFAREATQWVRAHSKLVFHTTVNELFVVDGDRASGESYVVAITVTRTGQGEVDTITGGRYLDRYERREGAWKLIERTFVMDCNLNQPSSGVYDDKMHPPGRMRGTFAPQDPSYRFWRTPLPGV